MEYFSFNRDKNRICRLWFTCLLAVSLQFCKVNSENYLEDAFACVHDLSYRDQQEIKKVAQHYQKTPQDSLKLKALSFLICNSRHLESFNSLQLRTSIDQAFDSWSYGLLCDKVDFATFCEYILPNNISGEKSEDWRSLVHLRYDSLVAANRFSNCNHESLVTVINDDAINWFKFNDNDQNLSWSELIETKTGNCVSMAKLLTFAARTYGVPVAIDFTPIWGNVNGLGHTWNSIVLSDSASIPFMGAEKNPGIYSPFILVTDKSKPENDTFRRCGKVFRSCYSVQLDNLEFAVRGNKGKDLIPTALQGAQYKDVTQEYTPVTDLDLHLDAQQNLDFSFVFLSVFNYGNWIPVWWSRPDSSGRVTFKDMGRYIVYLPSYHSTEGTLPAGFPRFIRGNGEIEILKPSKEITTNISILYTQSIESEQIDILRLGLEYNKREALQVEIGRNKNRSTVTDGDRYTLYYWDLEGWNVCSVAFATNGVVQFTKVPSNALYKVTGKNSVGDERIFKVENGKQIWL